MKTKTKIMLGIAILVLVSLGLYAKYSNTSPSAKQNGTLCTQQYDPVCGINGITYGNPCMAGEIEIEYKGECEDSNSVSNLMPVPGSDVPDMVVDPAGGTYPAGEVPDGLSNEELASS